MKLTVRVDMVGGRIIEWETEDHESVLEYCKWYKTTELVPQVIDAGRGTKVMTRSNIVTLEVWPTREKKNV